MTKLMKAAVLEKIGDIQLKEIPIPIPKEDEVLIRVKAVGLCGSDVHYYENGKIGPYVVEKPIILGHESAGEVVELGADVTNLTIGQRVTVEPGVTCGRCEFCKSGRYNLCPDVEFLATPPYDGAFCEYIAIRSDFVFPIPDEMSYERAALIEPLSVGIHACNRGHLKLGETVIIMGMGPIGMMAAIAAKSFGAKTIIGVDLEFNRLSTALEIGATHVINLKTDDLKESLKKITNDRGVDLAIETAGNPKALQSALESVTRGGRVVIVGLPPEPLTPFNVPFIADNEVDIYGVFRYSNTYPKGIEIMSNKEINIEALITDNYSIEDTQKAFEKSIHEKGSTIKVIIRP